MTTSTETETGAGNTGTDTTDTGTGTDKGQTAEVDKWKALARKHEQASKANEKAAAELVALKSSQQTADERTAERAQQSETRLAELEARILRRDIALEHKLTSDDAAMLDTITDEDAMRTLAKRLGAVDADRKKNGNHVPKEGTTHTTAKPDELREFTRNLFGVADD